jgi:methanogenic corrinoid protein MtbC1
MSPDRDVPSLPPVDPRASRSVPAASLTPELLASLLADGDDELAAWTLRHALQEAPRAAVFDGLVTDAMRLVGQRWLSGEWSIADEHWASQTLVRALDAIRPVLGPEGRVGPVAVLAAPAGELHVAGLVCLEQCLREAGWQVANLGPDCPAADIARFVGERAPHLVAITASHPDRMGAVLDAVAAVRAAGPGIPIAVGGSLAARPGAAATLGVDWAGTTIGGALAFAGMISRETTG